MLTKTIKTILTDPQPLLDQIPWRPSDAGIESYNTDESRTCGQAEGVFFPRNESEIATILLEAGLRNTLITLRGSGTGVVVGAVAKSGFVISTERMNRIDTPETIIDKGTPKTTMRVEAGAVISEISQIAQDSGFFYPVNPTETSASIGGNINTDAAGSRPAGNFSPCSEIRRKMGAHPGSLFPATSNICNVFSIFAMPFRRASTKNYAMKRWEPT